MKNNYIMQFPDGTEVTTELSKTQIPDINMEGLSGSELKEACKKLFNNLGWKIKQDSIVKMESGIFEPDIILQINGKDCGYVEVITSYEQQDIIDKQEVVKAIIDECKPRVFVLTNGKVFDIFYDGIFSCTQSLPPTMEDVERHERLSAYLKSLMKIKEDESNE